MVFPRLLGGGYIFRPVDRSAEVDYNTFYMVFVPIRSAFLPAPPLEEELYRKFLQRGANDEKLSENGQG